MVWIFLCCVSISVAALWYVFQPLLAGGASPFLVDLDRQSTTVRRLLRKKETIYENIKDLDFEYKMGKLSQGDYERLNQDYLREAYQVDSQIESIQPETLNEEDKPQGVALLKSIKGPKKSKKS